MKASVNKDSPFYTPYHALVKGVYFEGEKRVNVITANEEDGYIVEYIFQTGYPNLIEKTSHGIVKIELGDKLEYRNGKIELAK